RRSRHAGLRPGRLPRIPRVATGTPSSSILAPSVPRSRSDTTPGRQDSRSVPDSSLKSIISAPPVSSPVMMWAILSGRIDASLQQALGLRHHLLHAELALDPLSTGAF